MHCLRSWLLLCAALLFASFGHAKGVAPSVTNTASGVSINWKPASSGVANLTQSATAVSAQATAIANIAKGVSVEAVVTGAISGAAAAGGWGAAVGAVGAVAIAALPAIAEWMKRAGVKANPDGSFSGLDENVCTLSAGCTEYRYFKNAANGYTDFSLSAMAACTQWAAWSTSGARPGEVVVARSVNAGGQCIYVVQSGGSTSPEYSVSANTRTVFPPAPGTEPYVPLSLSQAQVRMGAASPTPAAVQELIDRNFPPEVAPVSITGPATAGETNTVQIGSDGATKTENCKFYLEYFPSNIKAHPECTTTTATPAKTETKQVVTTNPDGTTTTQTVTTTTPASTKTEVTSKDKPEPAAVCGLPGTPACKIDETGTATGIGALPQDDLVRELNKATDALPGIVSATGKDTSWGVLPAWTNQGPCSPWHVFTFPESVGSRSVDVDLCPLKPWADGISNFVWVALGFMGITSMVFATMTSKAN